MVKRGTAKRLKKRVMSNAKVLTIGLLLLGLVFTLYIGANGKRFSAFLSGDNVPFFGDIAFSGMSVEDEIKTFDRVDTFSLNFDGVPDWSKYLAGAPGGIDTEFNPGLVGLPACMPSTTWAFGSVYHIDSGTDSPKIIESDTTPSAITITDNIYYTELYRYSTDIYVRVHAAMPNVLWTSVYRLVFSDAESVVYLSHYIGEYAPMREIYTKVSVAIEAVNSSIIKTGTDMAANGKPDIKFWRWSENPTWGSGSLSQAAAYQIIQDELRGGVQINRDILQTGFDIAQGFNPTAKVDGRDSVYEFNIGFNFLSTPGYYYRDPTGLFEFMQLFDVQIKIPVTITVVAVYNLPPEQVDAFIALNPELGLPGGMLTIVGTAELPEDEDYGDIYPDNTLLNTIESLPGFDWLKGETGTYAAVIMMVIIGGVIGIVVRRR